MAKAPTPGGILNTADHRPYPLPGGPWAISMSWHDLLFMHWPVPVESLRHLIPPALSIDTFEGSAWLAVVPFRMSGVRPRLLPAVPALSDFPELNLRTYVTHDGKPGIWFFSLDAHNKVAVRLARATFDLPYFDAHMKFEKQNDSIYYKSFRTHRGAAPADYEARYRAVSEPEEHASGSIENFLTERYCLYSANSSGRLRRGDIHHHMWPLQQAEAEVRTLRMTEQIGVKLPDTAPLLHYSERLDVVAWPPGKVDK
jgi:uncharacterized protein YqjF (DUF2071 family)